MKIMRRVIVLSIFFSALAMGAPQHGSHPNDKLPVDPDWPQLTASMRKMHVAMAAIEPSGTSDVDFVRLMIPHHQAAIDMAKSQLLFGKDPQMRRLAQEIITDQESEIELMQLWLKQHPSPPTNATPTFPADKDKEN